MLSSPSLPISCTSTHGLALHTTTPDLGLALGQFPAPEDRALHIPRELFLGSSSLTPPTIQIQALGRSMASQLHSQLQKFLEFHPWSMINWLAVAKGPGGFTGARLGLVTARTIAQQLHLPILALSTLETMALHWAQDHDGYDRPLAVHMTAQRGQVFGGIYQCSTAPVPPQILLPDRLFTPEEWDHCYQTWPQTCQPIPVDTDLAASVGTLLELGYRYYATVDSPAQSFHWSKAQPFYGQHPVSLDTVSATPTG